MSRDRTDNRPESGTRAERRAHSVWRVLLASVRDAVAVELLGGAAVLAVLLGLLALAFTLGDGSGRCHDLPSVVAAGSGLVLGLSLAALTLPAAGLIPRRIGGGRFAAAAAGVALTAVVVGLAAFAVANCG